MMNQKQMHGQRLQFSFLNWQMEKMEPFGPQKDQRGVKEWENMISLPHLHTQEEKAAVVKGKSLNHLMLNRNLP